MLKKMTCAILLVLALSVAAFAADVKIGTFTSQNQSVRAIGEAVPLVEASFGVEKTQYSNTSLTLSLAATTNAVNQHGYFVRGGASVAKTYSIGNPNAKLSPYAGIGSGFYYLNGQGESGMDVGTSLIGGLRIGSSFFVETKYTDVRGSNQGDGFSVTVGGLF